MMLDALLGAMLGAMLDASDVSMPRPDPTRPVPIRPTFPARPSHLAHRFDLTAVSDAVLSASQGASARDAGNKTRPGRLGGQTETRRRHATAATRERPA